MIKCLLACYLCLILINFRMSLDNMETWTVDTKVNWLIVTLINPLFTICYWFAYFLYYSSVKRDNKKRRKKHENY